MAPKGIGDSELGKPSFLGSILNLGSVRFRIPAFFWYLKRLVIDILSSLELIRVIRILLVLYYIYIYLRSTPHPVTVTTRIITFLVGNPYKPSFATVTGRGVDPIYVCIYNI